MRLAATLIVLTQKPDELAPLFRSLRDAGVTDYVVGIDDRSADGTDLWLKAWFASKDDPLNSPGLTTFPFTFEDDFSKARNMTLERLPEGMDWFLWIDSDDTLEMQQGMTIPEYLETLGPDINSVFCDYQYHFDEYGNCDTLQTRHRILAAREKWFWANKVHEDIHIRGGKPLIAAETDAFVWVHHPVMENRDPERNFRILAKAIAEEPENPRNYYYLGNQHFAAHHWQEAIDAFARYRPKSPRIDEGWSANIYMGIAYQMLEDLDAASTCYMEAMRIQPKWADSYLGLGEVAARYGRWEQAIHWGEIGLQRVMAGDGIPDKTNFVNQNAYNFAPYLWLGQAYFNVGDSQKALGCFEQAARWRKEPDLLYKIRHLVAAMSRQQAIDKGKSLAAHLMLTNEPLKARAIFQNLPAGAAEQDSNVNLFRLSVERRISHLGDDTAYRNFYFKEGETVDPIEALPHVRKRFPRMHWVLQRLQAAGAKRILELGVGNAVSSFYYAQHGIQVVGIDVDWRRVKEANFNAVKLGYLKAYRPRRKTNGREPRMIQMEKDAQAQFHCCKADELSKMVTDLGPFDAVVACEIIEHVEHPERILDQAEKVSKRVILSTPDGSYDGPQDINPSHVRMWSQRELVPFIADRGRIVELHKIAHPNTGDQPTIAAEYVTGEKLGGYSVIIHCFNTGQEWHPDSITEGGIGGSETAVIRVAEELVKKGCRVTVYAEAEGVWNGVRYAHTNNFSERPCDLYVSWRSLGACPEMKDYARERWVWAHDIEFGDATEEQLQGVKVVALSGWHRKYMQEKYPSAEIIVSGNGIDPERFARETKRIPHRLIFGQSPDRGLDVLLRIFPGIKKRYPDAELHAFYGMDLLDRTGKRAFRQQIEAAAKQPGVTLHGRVSQEELAEEYGKADVLLYPGVQPSGKPFYETFSIAMLEAQAAGCIPITPSWGALPETNMFGILLDDPTDEKMLSSLYRIFEEKDSPLTATDREKMQVWARAQTWAKVVDGWLTVLTQKEPVLTV